MSVLDRINLFIEIYIRIIRSLKSVKLLAPFLLMAVIESIWLLALVYFYYPPVHKLLTPMLKYFFTDMALHFPQFYYVLPKVYKYGSLLGLDLIFGIILSAAAVYIIGVNFKHEKGGLIEGIRIAIRSFPALLIIWIIKTGLTVLAFKYCGPVVLPMVASYPFGYFAAFFIVQMLAVIISALLIYTYPAIMMHRQGLFTALGSGLKLALKNPFMTFIILFIPWLIQFPVNYLTSTKLYLILWKFNSSVLVYLLIAEIVISFAAKYLLFAGITYFYLNETE